MRSKPGYSLVTQVEVLHLHLPNSVLTYRYTWEVIHDHLALPPERAMPSPRVGKELLKILDVLLLDILESHLGNRLALALYHEIVERVLILFGDLIKI